MTTLFAKCCCILFITLWTPDGYNGEEITGAMAYYVKLDDNFDLNWNFNSTHIMFQTKVKIDGYVGFGISSSGRMFPGDVIIGWIRNGEAHFADRYAARHAVPRKDRRQNWTLLCSSKADGYTTLVFVRALDTNDNRRDIQIKAGDNYVIYSYNSHNPVDDNDIPYHGYQSRGSKSLNLLNPPDDMKVLS